MHIFTTTTGENTLTKLILNKTINSLRLLLFTLFALIASTSYAMAGSISGTVTDNAGVAIEGINVSASYKDGDYFSNAAQTQTDADGKYSFSNLPANDYKIEFNGNDKGYAYEVFDNASYDNPTLITLGENESKTADAKLDKKGIIRGKVVDINGQPIQGVTVYTCVPFDGTDWSHYTWFDSAITDENGEYVFERGLRAETYRLKFATQSQGFEFYKDATTILDAEDVVIANNDDKTIDIVLGDLASGTISGTVTDNAGVAIEGINVSASYKDGDYFSNAAQTQTNADGKYSFSNLPANDYMIGFSDYSKGYVSEVFDNASYDNPTLITLGENESKTADAKLDKKGIIRGKVVDINGQPIQGVTVYPYVPFDGTDWSHYSWFDSAITDENGEYVFERGLRAETYRLKFATQSQGFEFYKDATTILDAEDVVIANNDDKTIDIVLGDLASGTISGTVTDNAGVAIEGINVSASYKDGDYFSNAAQTQTDADGKYSFSNLPANDYKIEFSGYDKGYVSEVFDNASYDNPTLITLGENESKTADAKLDKKGIIRGKVVDINGQPIQGVTVYPYYQYYGSDWSDYTYDWSATTNENGEYVFEHGLYAETYRLKFATQSQGFEFYKDATTIQDAEDVVIANNDDKTINIVLGAPDEESEIEVSAVATDGTASEAGDDTGVITVTRTGDLDEALTLNFLVSGTATPGKDYEDIGNAVTIPAGASSATIEIVPIADYDTQEADETVIVTLIDPVADAGIQGKLARAKQTKKQPAAKVGGAPAIVTIINNPAPQNIPTLQQWALFLLIMLLLLSGLYYSRVEKKHY